MRIVKLYFPSFSFILLFSLIICSSISAQTIVPNRKDGAIINEQKKSSSPAFIKFIGDHVSLFGAIDLAKQSLNDKGITVPINYLYSAVNNNAYKPGYIGGFRIDPISKSKYSYSFSMAFNRIAAGTYYQNKYTNPPYINDYTHFKADHVFTTLSIAAHLKKMIFSDNASKYKFYLVVGPSFDYKISNLSNEQLINGAGNRSIINGDLGAEFNNKGYYTLFAHYKLGTNLFQSSVSVQLNRFEIGMSIRAKDLF